MFLKPLRAFCVALRASDHRLTDTIAIITPRTALDHRWTGRYEEHQVDIDKPLLLQLCESVKICPPGEPADHIAAKLGCSVRAVRHLRKTGVLSTNPKPGLMGRHGPPVPLVYSPEYLDPQARGRAGADDIFACCWRRNAEYIIDGFSQTVTRIPHYHAGPTPDHFFGWRWVCPRCQQPVTRLYCPTAPWDIPSFLGFQPAIDEPLPRPTPVFACVKCHDVVAFSRADLTDDWNNLILRVSGGLLFGYEVPKPDWLTPARKRPYRPQRLPPAPRRDQVQRLLLDTTLTYHKIAAHLGICYASVAKKALRLFELHQVKNRSQLKSLLRPAPALSAAG